MNNALQCIPDSMPFKQMMQTACAPGWGIGKCYPLVNPQKEEKGETPFLQVKYHKNGRFHA